jgi:hypothetical protein
LTPITDTLTVTGEYAYANNFEFRVKALTDFAKDYRLGGTLQIMGGYKTSLFSCLGYEPRLDEVHNGGMGIKAIG